MASYTPNYNLKKPADADSYDIADHNGNMDKIDTALNTLNSNLSKVGHTTTITATTLADLKTNLLDAVNGVASGDMLAVRIAPSFSSDGFTSGTTYGGYAYNIFKSGGTTSYFSAMISNNVGDGMRIGYNNGTWYFKPFQ